MIRFIAKTFGRHLIWPVAVWERAEHPLEGHHHHVSHRDDYVPPLKRNERIGLLITGLVGNMWCAYAFALLTLYGLPTAIHNGPAAFVNWVSSNFLQLVLLPIIIVGQNLQAKRDKALADAHHDNHAKILAAIQDRAA